MFDYRFNQIRKYLCIKVLCEFSNLDQIQSTDTCHLISRFISKIELGRAHLPKFKELINIEWIIPPSEFLEQLYLVFLQNGLSLQDWSQCCSQCCQYQSQCCSYIFSNPAGSVSSHFCDDQGPRSCESASNMANNTNLIKNKTDSVRFCVLRNVRTRPRLQIYFWQH